MRKEASTVDPRVLGWLLETSNPSVRYFTLRGLLGAKEDDAEVRAAASAIMDSEAVRTVLASQEPDGHWLAPDRFYTGKYRSTVWQLLVLAELGADRADDRIQKACAFILDRAQDRESGGFSTGGSRKGGGRHSEVIPCLTGNMLWVLVRFGWLKDERVQRTIDWITTYQRFDDGTDVAPSGWPYDRFEMCWGRHTCFMGIVKALKGLGEIPPRQRSPAVRETIARGAEFMLIHHVFKRSHNLARVSKPGWRRFGFPLMYQTDALEILNLLLDLGYRDRRMEDAFELVESRRGADGRWILENSYNDRLLAPIESQGRAGKWVTLHALRALARRHELR
jgi:hypothetical protein